MPTDPTLRFTNVQNELKAPFVVYADFECILKDVRDHEGKEAAPDVGPKNQDLPNACTL